MTIKWKLYCIGLLTLAGFGLVEIVNHWAERAIFDKVALKENILTAEVSLLQTRRREKDFLAEREEADLALQKEQAAQTGASLSSARGMHSVLAEKIDAALLDLEKYEKAFSSVAEEVIRQGLTDDKGLRGALRASIHEVEGAIEAVNDDTMLAAMLMLRRAEKDFLLRRDFTQQEKFHKSMGKMLALVRDSHLWEESRKEVVSGLLDNYAKSFDALVESARKAAADTDAFKKAARTLNDTMEKLIVQVTEETQADIHRLNMIVVAVQTLAALSVLVTLFMVIRSILKPLRRLQDCSLRVAEGDYDACLKEHMTGELEALRLDVVSMVGALKKAMDEAENKERDAAEQARKATEAMGEAHRQAEHVKALVARMTVVAEQASDIATRMAATSEELSNQADSIARGAETQKNRVLETATAMEQMTATVLEVAHNSSLAAESATLNRSHAKDGQEKVHDTLTAVEEVQNITGELMSVMDELNGKAQSIGTVMNVISDIADQTNLLALNAAIEAARAGEAGRGFAVVADEVRKLAEKTMTATREVGEAIQGIQSAVKSSVSKSHAADEALDKATGQARAAGELLEGIVGTVESSADMVRNIATATEEQSSTTEEINRSVDEINRISAETAEGMRGSAQAIQEIASLASQLEELIDELRAAAA